MRNGVYLMLNLQHEDAIRIIIAILVLLLLPECVKLQMSLQYLGTGDGSIRGKLLPESLIIYAIVQVLHIQIHPLQSEIVRIQFSAFSLTLHFLHYFLCFSIITVSKVLQECALT